MTLRSKMMVKDAFPKINVEALLFKNLDNITNP